jgi:ribosome-associated heat shock protein Hsp15
MSGKTPVRIDKFLWAVRLFKTRTLAANACKMGRILINGNNIKSSAKLNGDETLTVRKPPAIYTYKIKDLTENRVGAKLVVNFLEDITPEEEKLKLDLSHSAPVAYREKGTGRPTKKERRIIDRWKDVFFF